MKNKKTLYCRIFSDCCRNNLRLWECPSFLFLITGLITIVIMITTYLLTTIYTSPEYVIVSVVAITIIMFIAGYSITQGVSKITQARISAEREKTKTEAIVMNLSDGLIMLDNTYKIILINPQAEKYLGVKKDQVIGVKTFEDKIKQLPNFKKIINKIPPNPLKLKTIKENVLIKTPKKKYLQVVTSPVYDDRKTFLGFVKVLHDITKEKEIDQMKSEFVSIASHQLRSPLSSLKWLIEILLKKRIGDLTEEQSKLLGQMDISNERMIKIVQDLLNVSRIEEGKASLELKKTDLNKIIQETISILNPQAEQKGIEISFEEIDLPEINLDPEKIKIAIQNLIDNAIKYSKEKRPIEIKEQIKDNQLLVSIRDNGIGVPSEDQDRIFTKFYRSEDAKSLVVHGTGLGLYITKKIIDAHKGKIWFKSSDQGTAFYIKLPTNLK